MSFGLTAPVRRRYLIALVGITALGAVVSPAGASSGRSYHESEYRIPASEPAPSAMIATLLGGATAASTIDEGLYSPDHSHISFRMAGVASWGAPIHATWVMRADGSQRRQLRYTLDGDASLVTLPVRWASDSVLTWLTVSSGSSGTFREWLQLDASSTDDRWSSASERGYVTLDGRYRVELAVHPFDGKARDVATDLRTGRTYVVRRAGRNSELYVPQWNEACRMPDGTPPPKDFSIAAALAGDDPICDFGRSAGPVDMPTPTPSPEPIPTPAPVVAPTPVETLTPAATPTFVAAPAPLPSTTAVPFAAVGPVLSNLRFSRQLGPARTKGLRIKVSIVGATSAKAWLIDATSKRVLARRSVPTLAPGTTTLVLPPARKLGTRTSKVVVRLTAIDAAGRQTTVERAAVLNP